MHGIMRTERPGIASTIPAMVNNLMRGADVADSTCLVRGCGRPRKASGWCSGHYLRWRTTGDVREAEPLRVMSAPDRPCSVEGCDETQRRSMCQRHRDQLRRRGTTETIPAATPSERFWSHVRKSDGCWEWTGKKRYGYGVAYLSRTRSQGAHRFAYVEANGAVPEGLELDHLCRNRACVRPDHLEAVTHAENVRRSEGVSALHARQTHCGANHEFTPENTRVTPSGGRVCRACHRERERGRSAAAAPKLKPGTDVRLPDGTLGTVEPK